MYKTCGIFCILGVLLSLLVSCDRALSPVGHVESPDTDATEQADVGVKLENPYTVESMMKARDNLEDQGVIRESAIGDELFTPTHYYIRINPQSMDEYLKINQTSNLVLWDYPLD